MLDEFKNQNMMLNLSKNDLHFQHEKITTIVLPHMVSSSPQYMTDLEEQLAATNAIELKNQLLANLEEMESHLRLKIAASLTRSEYVNCLALAEASHSAIEVLRRWPVQGFENPSSDSFFYNLLNIKNP